MRDANVSWVSIVEKKLGLEMDDDSDDDDSQIDIGEYFSITSVLIKPQK